MKTFNKKITIAITVIFITITVIQFNLKNSFGSQNTEEEDVVISTMSVYKDMDYTFLKTYNFGGTNSDKAVLTFNTAEQLMASEDIRLKKNKYITTKGYYEEGDLGGATYLISDKAEAYGTIELKNGLYANIVPDSYVSADGTKWVVISVKQCRAKGDSENEDQIGINVALNLASSYANSDEYDRGIVYIPKGEYKAYNQIQANVQNINLIGDGDESIIFTDNDYRKSTSYDEPFFASWNGNNNFFGFFKIEAREVNHKRYMRQMCLYYCENVYIYDITYYIPQEAWTGTYYEDKQYTNLTMHTGNKMITVDNCLMYQMSGTYRGANIGVMDIWQTGTENITIMNCELHDNARDEQIGIHSVTEKPASYIKNVDFIDNTIYTYTTPYKEIHGGRTMCFTVAYGDNEVDDINISGNHFISEIDSKFMTFGDVTNCKVTNNIFEIICLYNSGSYVFDSSCGNASDVLIDNNEFFLTYKNSTSEGRTFAAGNLTFSNNRVVSDCNIGKLADCMGIYDNNTYIALNGITSFGSAIICTNNTLTAYAGHNSFYNELFGMINYTDENADIVYTGNKVNDYTYFYDYKATKPYDKLVAIGATLRSLTFSNNVYNCPNYRYKNADEYIYISWYRGANIANFICENNDFQGAKGMLGYEIDDSVNTTREFTSDPDVPRITSMDITNNGEIVTEITTMANSITLDKIVRIAKETDEEGNILSEEEVTDRDIDWVSAIESIATVEDGVVTRNDYGNVYVYATSKDGSGVYGKVKINFNEIKVTTPEEEPDEPTDEPSEEEPEPEPDKPTDEPSEFESLNKLIEIDDKIYVQHKEPDENGYIYDSYLLTSEGEETTIYEVLNLKYTAGKQWTRDGLYIDDSTLKVVATAPEDYAQVKEGEEFFVRLYGIGDLYTGENGDEWHITSPIVFFNDDNVCVGNELSSTMSKSKVGVTFTVPEGATKMYVSNYCNQNITVQRKMVVTSEEFNKIKEEQDKILNYVDSNYSQITEDPIIYEELDKAYITFVNDDTTPAVDQFADLFIENNTPLCLATIADNLPNYASNGIETRLDVALRVQEAGGEILAHNGPVITEDTIEDNEFMYNYFAIQKKLLTRMGLDVNGIILAGGNGQIVGDSRSAKWASSLYSYSDLLGEKYETPFGVDSVYFHYRNNIGNYGNDIDKIKEKIDSVVKNKEWHVFYFHNTNEVTLETLQAVIDYINSIGTDKVEVVTYETMYEKFAVRESSVKTDSKTYYVSANGTSTDGTDINDPINLDTLNTKKLKTGDTVLFKSGDTFFGTLNFEVYDTDNGVVTISSYGEGDLPTISTYKYITSSWEEYSDNIYRIDISNTNNFTGYISNETHAYNVGFIEDDAGAKYYNKKVSIENLENNFDFYSDGSQYLYMYLDSGNPYEKIGNVKAIVRSNLMTLDSNMDIKNIRLSYTGGHAIEGCATNLSNITIENCIIENIGGSYLYSTDLTKDTRYGNGIEFYGSNVSDITIKNNIIRNVYDVAFTIQGTSGSGTNVNVYDNVMVNNSQDSEIWESGSATGVVGYKYYNNISINQGRGWGYGARPDQYASAAILFWGYNIDNTDIEFTNNLMYNPRRIYFAAYQNNTNEFFKQADKIKSDYNTYYLGTDAKLFREEGSILDTSCLEEIYNKDANSTFLLLEEVDDNIIQVATTSNEISTIRKLFGIEDEEEPNEPVEEPKEDDNQEPEPSDPVEEPKEDDNQEPEPSDPVEEPKEDDNQEPEPSDPVDEPNEDDNQEPEPSDPVEEPKEDDNQEPEPSDPVEEPKEEDNQEPESSEPVNETNETDNTIISGILPYTGMRINNVIIVIMIILSGTSIMYYIRYRKIK